MNNMPQPNMYYNNPGYNSAYPTSISTSSYPGPNQYTYSNYLNTNNVAQQSMRWVDGKEGANSFPMRPNDVVSLFDRQNDGIFYIKISDDAGMCKLRTFSYMEIIEDTSSSKNDYITRDEFFSAIDDLKSAFRSNNNSGNNRRGGSNNNGEQSVSGTK